VRASDRLDRAGAPATALAVGATALPRPVSSGKQLAHFAKRWLYLIHRWVGIGASLLLAMWFLSGFVMLYVPYPSLTRAERLAGLAPIQPRRARRPTCRCPLRRHHPSEFSANDTRSANPLTGSSSVSDTRSQKRYDP